MNQGRGNHLCRICKQNQSWLKVDAEPDSGILGLQAGEDVNDILGLLKDKNKGILSKDKQALLDSALVNLHMQYIKDMEGKK